MNRPNAATQLSSAANPQRRPRALPASALGYFWFLNNDCPIDELRKEIKQFAEERVGALVLHPRSGLLVPYLSKDWFDLIRELVDECVKVGIEPWLYDEDYCPSGTAGGWVTFENPE